jgi:signal transduction histidine kinase
MTNIFTSLVETVNSIGISPSDGEEAKSSKRSLVWLAFLMSVGGMVWGTLLAYFQLTTQALIPFGYVVLSIINVRMLQHVKSVKPSSNFQIFISLLLPYVLQWMLGGFFASGVVMLWATLALIGSITILRGKVSFLWLVWYVLLAVFSFVIDPDLEVPAILTQQVSMALLLINVIMIFGIIFFLAKVRTDTDSTLKQQLRVAYTALQKAKEEAEESNMLKTVFLGNLSHEVRTPLQGIQGMTELLEIKTMNEGDRKRYIGLIKKRTQDLQNIIEALLDLASLENSEIKAFPQERNLHEAVESSFRENRVIHADAFLQKPVKFLLQNHLKATDTAYFDPRHFTQVLINLIGNAIKFTDKGEVVLVAERKGNSYVIEVVDSGIGISQDKIEHIFKPFRQAHEGFSRTKGGIGLGLSICKKMIELWGGNFTVQSSERVGSVFSFSIPIRTNL